MIKNNMFGTSITEQSGGASDENAFHSTAPGAVLAPITVFGLSPVEAGTARLVDESILFVKAGKENTADMGIWNNYTVEMRYTVETYGKASFVLPYAYVKEKFDEELQKLNGGREMLADYTEIYVNGKAAEFETEEHPNIIVNRPTYYEGASLQSVDIYPDCMLQDVQPDNTYAMLLDSWKKEPDKRIDGDTPALRELAGQVDMYTFGVDGAGTYELVIKVIAVGDFGSGREKLEFCDSPSDMWKEVGERIMTVEFKGEKYRCEISDMLTRFVQPSE